MNPFYLTHLYPDKMSIYGDMGNIIALKYKLKNIGFDVVYQPVLYSEPLPKQSDFYFIGGGQDSDQFLIFNDLTNKANKLKEDINIGVPLLSICGGYQLLGEKFTTGDGKLIEGIGLFPVITKSPDTSVKSRCIGNLVINTNSGLCDGVGDIVGFENHGGQTYINQIALQNHNVSYLGKVLVGHGNNHEEGFEGCVYKNAIGTYLHGSCLPKNPNLCNWLIKKSIEVKSLREDKPILLENFIPKIIQLNDVIANSTQKQLIDRWVNT
jgi:lipid II isoglutaminyl synthase (glutamine-hydrolysing)